jgi:hypothetical protein
VLILSDNSTVIYDPNGGAQRQLASINGVVLATRSVDGRVLVVGLKEGVANANEGLVNQLFDPATDTFSGVGHMVTNRQDAYSVALADGRILIGGGIDSLDGDDIPLTTFEVFDPATGEFSDPGLDSGLTSIGPMALLSDGRVLITGGHGEKWPWHTTAPNGTRAAVIYDPSSGAVAPTGDPQHAPRSIFGTADGGALMLWSTANKSGMDSWDPSSGEFGAVAITTPFLIRQAVLLDDGRILGTHDFDTLLIDAQGNVTTLPARVAWEPSVALLADGRAMIAGGLVDGSVILTPPGGARGADPVDTVVFFE